MVASSMKGGVSNMEILTGSEPINPDFGTYALVLDCRDRGAAHDVRWTTDGRFMSMLKAHTQVQYVDRVPLTLPESMRDLLHMTTIPGWWPNDPSESVVETREGIAESEVCELLPYVLAMVERPDDVDAQRSLLGEWGVA